MKAFPHKELRHQAQGQARAGERPARCSRSCSTTSPQVLGVYRCRRCSSSRTTKPADIQLANVMEKAELCPVVRGAAAPAAGQDRGGDRVPVGRAGSDLHAARVLPEVWRCTTNTELKVALLAAIAPGAPNFPVPPELIAPTCSRRWRQIQTRVAPGVLEQLGAVGAVTSCRRRPARWTCRSGSTRSTRPRTGLGSSCAVTSRWRAHGLGRARGRGRAAGEGQGQGAGAVLGVEEYFAVRQQLGLDHRLSKPALGVGCPVGRGTRAVLQRQVAQIGGDVLGGGPRKEARFPHHARLRGGRRGRPDPCGAPERPPAVAPWRGRLAGVARGPTSGGRGCTAAPTTSVGRTSDATPPRADESASSSMGRCRCRGGLPVEGEHKPLRRGRSGGAAAHKWAPRGAGVGPKVARARPGRRP